VLAVTPQRRARSGASPCSAPVPPAARCLFAARRPGGSSSPLAGTTGARTAGAGAVGGRAIRAHSTGVARSAELPSSKSTSTSPRAPTLLTVPTNARARLHAARATSYVRCRALACALAGVLVQQALTARSTGVYI
jgi:hypothetical protein